MKITTQIFDEVKRYKLWHSDYRTISTFGISKKTLVQIKSSKDFGAYTEQNLAQHPPIQYSLADSVSDLHDIVFNNHDNKYIKPMTARKACQELKLHFIKEKK